MKLKHPNTITETIIFLYSILFLYTGISKLIDFSVFKEQLSESPILAPISSFIAVTLPLAEFVIVIMMIIPKWRLKGFYAGLSLMIVFTIYIIALLSFSENIPCSCGGILSLLSWPQHIILNVVFIAIAMLGILMQKRQIKANLKQWKNLVQTDHGITAKPA